MQCNSISKSLANTFWLTFRYDSPPLKLHVMIQGAESWTDFMPMFICKLQMTLVCGFLAFLWRELVKVNAMNT